MKGAVFIGFNQFVEQELGLEAWLELLELVELPSGGIYLATEIYDDDEFTILINGLANLVNDTRPSLERKFGLFFFPTLMSLVVKTVENIANLFDFLHLVDNVIHREVQKSDPLAYTPSLYYDQQDQNTLIMRYQSKRKLCFFAEGLILGAAQHFKQKVIVSQSSCMCEGADYCLIKIAIQSPS